ncbi:MAG: hypothetical protein Q8L85_07505 [Alphaproteobacteria bacterium]|nr:hypothetical protein [Alphaproteobacteria bacterium]
MKKLTIFFVVLVGLSFNSRVTFADRCEDLWNANNAGGALTKLDISKSLTKKGVKPYKSEMHKGVDKATFISICKSNLALGYSS